MTSFSPPVLLDQNKPRSIYAVRLVSGLGNLLFANKTWISIPAKAQADLTG